MKNLALGALGFLAALTPVSGQQPFGLSTNSPRDLSVTPNANALFRLGISGGTPPYTISWQFNDAAIDPLLNPTVTNSLLVVSNVTLAHAGRYSAVVSDAANSSATSRVATLTVDATFTKITGGAIVNDRGNSYVPSWGDCDSDGWLDLFIANGGREGAARQFLYRNNRDGTFTRMTTNEVGDLAADSIPSAEGQWGDYDNDGDLDLFIGFSNWPGANRLYLNEGNGRFTRVTTDVGVNIQLAWTWGSAWRTTIMTVSWISTWPPVGPASGWTGCTTTKATGRSARRQASGSAARCPSASGRGAMPTTMGISTYWWGA